MSKITIVKSWLPVFSGFVYTNWDYSDRIDNELSKAGLPEEFRWWEHWDRDGYEREVAAACTEQLLAWLPKAAGITKMEMEKVVNQKEYNFENDAIDVTYHVDMAKFGKFFRAMVRYFPGDWAAYLLRYKSRDGFSSYHSHEPEVWKWLTRNYKSFDPRPDSDFYQREYFPRHVLGSCLQFWFEMEGRRRFPGRSDWDMEDCLYETVISFINITDYLKLPEAA